MGREWFVVLDEQWRLTLPPELYGRFGDTVIMRLSEDKCIRIISEKSFRNKDGIDRRIYGRSCCRLMSIPKQLRDSNSFFLGRKVRLVEKGGRGRYFLEIQPWGGEIK